MDKPWGKRYERRNKIIRKMVKDSLQKNNSTLSLSLTIQNIIAYKTPLAFRIISIIALIISFTLCAYLIIDRLLYFKSHPVTVDVRMHADQVDFPLFSVCSQDTKIINNQRKNKNIDDLNAMASNLLLDLIRDQNNSFTDLDKLWQATNRCDVLEVELYKNNKKMTRPSLNAQLHPMGICIEIKTDEVLRQNEIGKITTSLPRNRNLSIAAVLFGEVRSKEQPWNFKSAWLASNGAKTTVEIAVTKYTFLNTSTKFCTENKEFASCSKKCLKKAYKKLNFSCRFPFDLKVDLPLCPKSDSSLHNYTQSTLLFYKYDTTKECNCLKSCEHIAFSISQTIHFIDPNYNKSSINFKINSNEFITASQRYLYDSLSFASDIGGNFGLFLGISLLTIFEFVHNIFTSYRKLNFPFTKHPALYKKVKAQCKQAQSTLHHHNYKSRRILRIAQILLCVITASIPVYFGLKEYFDLSIQTSIRVIENTTMNFPKLIICGDGVAFQRIKKKRMIHPNLTCNMTIQQAIPEYNDTLDTLWQSTALKNELNNFDGDFLNKFNQSVFTLLVPNNSSLDTKTLFGMCKQVKIDTFEYKGTYSVSALLISYNALCKPQQNLIPFTLFYGDQVIPLLSQWDLPILGKLYIDFLAKEVHRLNDSRKPCTTISDAKNCLEKCVTTLLLFKVSCRLPYWNLPLRMCENKIEAAQVYDSYLRIFINANSICPCIQPCDETIYHVQPYFEPTDYAESEFSFVAVVFRFRHNFVEHIEEVYSYSLAALLSNLSSILGLVLGISVLSMVNNLATILKFNTPFTKN